MKHLYTLLFFLFFSSSWLSAQSSISGDLRGTVLSKGSLQPLIGTTIELTNNSFNTASVADSAGVFSLKNIPVGRYKATINYLGYDQLTIAEVLIESGKQKVLHIQLTESTAELQQIVVKADADYLPLSTPGSHELTIEEMQRLPATFFDPARLAMLYPGVAGINDQANGLSIRGLPSNLTEWRLEGVPIVNPNHLSNAGTISDFPSISAGGVNMLSAQMLDNSRLYTGAFPIEQSNVIGGLMDMRLRNGNSEQNEYTFQAGLLGMDVSMEGPFSEKSDISYLVNYRYSFTGLLAAFGVDFDGETIRFDDVAATIHIPTERIGDFKLFGATGKSRNFKEGLDVEEATTIFDIDDVLYSSNTNILGVSHRTRLGARSSLKTSIVYSGLRTIYSQNYEEVEFLNQIDNNAQQIAGLSTLTTRLNKKMNLKTGLNVSFRNTTNFQFSADPFFLAENRSVATDTFQNFQVVPFAEVSWNILPRLTVTGGANVNLLKFDRQNDNKNYIGVIDTLLEYRRLFSGDLRRTNVDLRGSLFFDLTQNQTLTYYIGRHSNIWELDRVFINFAEDTDVYQFSHALQQSIKYTNSAIKNSIFSAEVFYQTISKIPVDDDSDISYYDQNEFLYDNYFGNDIHGETGLARNFGLELFYQRFMRNNWFCLVSGTLYESQTKPLEYRDYHIARFNGNWIANAAVGKEWIKEKKEKTRVFGLHLRGVHRGGFWEREANVDYFYGSVNLGSRFTENLPNYFRIDIRTYFRWNKPNRTTSLSLDIQNATNHENVSHTNLDNTSENFLQYENQLGLIPMLNFRIEF